MALSISTSFPLILPHISKVHVYFQLEEDTFLCHMSNIKWAALELTFQKHSIQGTNINWKPKDLPKLEMPKAK